MLRKVIKDNVLYYNFSIVHTNLVLVYSRAQNKYCTKFSYYNKDISYFIFKPIYYALVSINIYIMCYITFEALISNKPDATLVSVVYNV